MEGLRLCTSLLLVALCSAYTRNYTGHHLWRVYEVEDRQLNAVRSIIKDFDLDVWSSGQNWVDFRVIPDKLGLLGVTLASNWLMYEIRDGNLQRSVDEELKTLKPGKPSGGIAIDEYNDFETIEAFMKEATSTYDWVTMESIGKTTEGRDLWVNILSVPSDAAKPAAWIDCGIHAREWITHSTCVFGLDYLTKGYGNDEAVTALLDKYIIYLMPVYNPDGYAYTWSDDRYWRKNRVKTADPGCIGVDLNRNQDDGHWDGPFSSTDPCSDGYRGTAPFSEPESKAVSDYITSIMDNHQVKAYFNLHSYSQLFMHAYGWTFELPPENEVLEAVSKTAVDAIHASHGLSFEYGTIAATVYPANGDAADWAYKAGIVHAYGIELRDASSFVLSKDNIIPAGEETWAGLMAALMAI